MNIWQKLASEKQPFFVLAPMDDVTDSTFRKLVAEWAAPDLFFTEFASADGLQSAGRSAVMQKLDFTEAERPLIAQIWGKNPDAYRKTAAEIVEMGFDGLDINMGCPVPKVTKNGCCSALINNRPFAAELIQAAKDGIDGKIAFSVKTRIGFNEIDLTWIEFLLEQGLDALTIHGRTTKEQSKVPMHWEVFAEIVALRDRIAPETILIGNGDILSYADGVAKAEEHKLDGIMIGRGVFHDPFVFSKDSPWKNLSREDKIAMYVAHINSWEADKPTANPSALKKFCKVYVNGFDGASELRSKIMECSSFQQMRDVLNN